MLDTWAPLAPCFARGAQPCSAGGQGGTGGRGGAPGGGAGGGGKRGGGREGGVKARAPRQRRQPQPVPAKQDSRPSTRPRSARRGPPDLQREQRAHARLQRLHAPQQRRGRRPRGRAGPRPPCPLRERRHALLQRTHALQDRWRARGRALIWRRRAAGDLRASERSARRSECGRALLRGMSQPSARGAPPQACTPPTQLPVVPGWSLSKRRICSRGASARDNAALRAALGFGQRWRRLCVTITCRLIQPQRGKAVTDQALQALHSRGTKSGRRAGAPVGWPQRRPPRRGWRRARRRRCWRAPVRPTR